MKSVRDRSFPYQHREEKERNWHQYDQAQVNEIADVLETIRAVVDLASLDTQERKRSPGKPPFRDADIVKVMLMQAYFGMPNRIVAGFLRLLDSVLLIMNESGNAKERIFSTDGTGDPASMKINYESERSMQRLRRKDRESGAFPGRKHDFQYSVFATGVHTKIIAGFETSDDHGIGELSYFPAVIGQTKVLCPQADTMFGDALYGNRKSSAISSGHGMKHYFMPRINASFQALGTPSWKRSLYDFVDHAEEWLEQYHMRSIYRSASTR